MGRFYYTASAVLVLGTLVLLLAGCATQARTPWGNLDMKGGSGSECKPFVAPDAGRRQLPTIRPIRPVAPVAPVIVQPPPVPVPPSAEVSGGAWPPPKCGPVLGEVACLD